MPSVVFCVSGRSDLWFWVWVVVFFCFSVHLGEKRPEQKKKLELAKSLMIWRLLCSSGLPGPTFAFGREFVFFGGGRVSAHLGEMRPKHKNKMEIARSLMICRLLCSASGPTFGFEEKFCFCLTSKT